MIVVLYKKKLGGPLSSTCPASLTKSSTWADMMKQTKFPGANSCFLHTSFSKMGRCAEFKCPRKAHCSIQKLFILTLLVLPLHSLFSLKGMSQVHLLLDVLLIYTHKQMYTIFILGNTEDKKKKTRQQTKTDIHHPLLFHYVLFGRTVNISS